MMIQNLLKTKRFVVCHGYASAEERVLVSNSNSGDFNQFIYLLGGVETELAPADKNSSLPAIKLQRGLTDISTYYGTPIVYTPTEEGVTWVCINPIPLTARYEVSELVDGQVIQGTLKEKTILCILNCIKVNDKDINSMQYCRVYDGVVANISIPSGSKALLVERIPDFSAPPVEKNIGQIPTTTF
jgi:hypothetical protein